MRLPDRKKWLTALLAGLVILSALSQGCVRTRHFGKGVLATIDNQPLTVEEYKIVVGRIPTDFKKRKRRLQQMISTRLLAEEALAKGYLGTSAVYWGMQRFYYFRLPELLKWDVYNKIKVDKNKLDAIRKAMNLQTVVHVKMLVAPTIGRAQAALSDLEKGEKFEDVAAKYTVVKSDVRHEISLDDSLYPIGVRAILNRTKPGQLTPPMKLDIGYAVMQVQSKDDPAAVWKSVEDRMAGNLKQQEMKKEMADILARLRSTAKIKIYSQKNKQGQTIYTGAEVNGININMNPRLFKRQNNPHFAHTMMNAQTLMAALNERINDILYTEEAKARGLQYNPRFREDVRLKREEVLADCYLEAMVGNNTATPQDIENYYEKYKKRHEQNRLARISHILLPSESQAETVLSELKKGKDFARLAKEMSLDLPTKNAGGVVGFIDPKTLKEPMKSVIMGMKPGEISGIVKGPAGYEIVKVTEWKNEIVPPLSEIKDEMTNRVLLNKRSDKVTALYKVVYAKHKVEINEQLLKSL